MPIIKKILLFFVMAVAITLAYIYEPINKNVDIWSYILCGLMFIGSIIIYSQIKGSKEALKNE